MCVFEIYKNVMVTTGAYFGSSCAITVGTVGFAASCSPIMIDPCTGCRTFHHCSNLAGYYC